MSSRALSLEDVRIFIVFALSVFIAANYFLVVPLGRSYTTTNDYYDAPYHHISSSTQQNAKHQTSSNYVASRTNINETSIKNKSLFIKTNTTIQDNTMRDLLIGFAMNYDVSAIYRTVHAFHEHVPGPQQQIALFVNLPESIKIELTNRFPRVTLLNPDEVVDPNMEFMNISISRSHLNRTPGIVNRYLFLEKDTTNKIAYLLSKSWRPHPSRKRRR